MEREISRGAGEGEELEGAGVAGGGIIEGRRQAGVIAAGYPFVEAELPYETGFYAGEGIVHIALDSGGAALGIPDTDLVEAAVERRSGAGNGLTEEEVVAGAGAEGAGYGIEEVPVDIDVGG